jgi:hypothetical protein
LGTLTIPLSLIRLAKRASHDCADDHSLLGNLRRALYVDLGGAL